MDLNQICLSEFGHVPPACFDPGGNFAWSCRKNRNDFHRIFKKKKLCFVGKINDFHSF